MATHVLVADEVWIATAELHQKNPNQGDFSQVEIVDRVIENELHRTLRPGVMIHTSQHCVADRRPNPGNYCMLISPVDGSSRRRLWKPSDASRTSKGRDGKKVPSLADIPDKYKKRVRDLIDWWHTTHVISSKNYGIY